MVVPVVLSYTKKLCPCSPFPWRSFAGSFSDAVGLAVHVIVTTQLAVEGGCSFFIFA